MTGALKELKEMHRGDEGHGSGEKKAEMLTVRFVGEAEEYSR